MSNYYQLVNAIREHKPTQHIEKLRRHVSYDWEDPGENSKLSTPAEAMAMAIELDNIYYVEYLLRYQLSQALDMEGRCCPHILLTVKWNRPKILDKILLYSTTCYRPKLDQGHIQGEKRTSLDTTSTPIPFRKKSVKPPSVRLNTAFFINCKGCRSYGYLKSAIHLACELGHTECVKTLLMYGATPTVKDVRGKTPLEYCLFESRTQWAPDRERMYECADLLLRSIVHIDEGIREQFRILKSNKFTDEYIHDIESLFISPMTLFHLCRCRIRESIGLGRLPWAIDSLPIPCPLKRYLTLDI
ncbi:ankyrin repeat domain-containing protein 9-like [Glandiceps talaboti]